MLKTLVSSFLARHRAARLTRPTRLAAALMGCCLMAVLLLSCSSDENEYCSYPCRFVFNTQRHGQSAALMGVTSGTGVFCKVTTTIRGGAQYYRFENNAGLTDNVIFTQEDKQTTVLLGLNGSLIVGWSNLDDPKQFYAFDGECPNCFSPYDSSNVVNLNGGTGKLKKGGSSAFVCCRESVDYRHRAVGSAGGVVAVELTPVVARCHVAARVEVILD